MTSEMLPFPQDERSNEYSLSETIDVLIQAEIEALKHAEMVSAQLVQVLKQQITEVESLKTEIKQRRDVPRSLKKVCEEQDYRWNVISVEIKSYQEELENHRIWLESEYKKCHEDLDAFKLLQEEIIKFLPR